MAVDDGGGLGWGLRASQENGPGIIGSVTLYTRTGDAGETSLFDGTRVSKSDARVDAYGHVDELNAVLGQTRAGHAGRDALAGIGELSTDGEQVLLDAIEPAVDRRVQARRASLAQHRVQLVDVAVGVHPGIGLADTRPVEQ